MTIFGDNMNNTNDKKTAIATQMLSDFSHNRMKNSEHYISAIAILLRTASTETGINYEDLSGFLVSNNKIHITRDVMKKGLCIGSEKAASAMRILKASKLVNDDKGVNVVLPRYVLSSDERVDFLKETMPILTTLGVTSDELKEHVERLLDNDTIVYTPTCFKRVDISHLSESKKLLLKIPNERLSNFTAKIDDTDALIEFTTKHNLDRYSFFNDCKVAISKLINLHSLNKGSLIFEFLTMVGIVDVQGHIIETDDDFTKYEKAFKRLHNKKEAISRIKKHIAVFISDNKLSIYDLYFGIENREILKRHEYIPPAFNSELFNTDLSFTDIVFNYDDIIRKCDLMQLYLIKQRVGLSEVIIHIRRIADTIMDARVMNAMKTRLLLDTAIVKNLNKNASIHVLNQLQHLINVTSIEYDYFAKVIKYCEPVDSVLSVNDVDGVEPVDSVPSVNGVASGVNVVPITKELMHENEYTARVYGNEVAIRDAIMEKLKDGRIGKEAARRLAEDDYHQPYLPQPKIVKNKLIDKNVYYTIPDQEGLFLLNKTSQFIGSMFARLHNKTIIDSDTGETLRTHKKGSL